MQLSSQQCKESQHVQKEGISKVTNTYLERIIAGCSSKPDEKMRAKDLVVKIYLQTYIYIF